MNIIKKEKMRIFSLILVECGVLLFMSFGVAALIFSAFGNIFGKPFQALIPLLCCVPIFSLVACHEKLPLIKKIASVPFTIVWAFAVGILIYALGVTVSPGKFLFLTAIALFAFLITACPGYLFAKQIKNWHPGKIIPVILIIGLTAQMVTIFCNIHFSNVVLSVTLILLTACFNLKDFADMSGELDKILEGKFPSKGYLILATKLYLNFIGFIFLPDATRFVLRAVYGIISEKTLKTQN